MELKDFVYKMAAGLVIFVAVVLGFIARSQNYELKELKKQLADEKVRYEMGIGSQCAKQINYFVTHKRILQVVDGNETIILETEVMDENGIVTNDKGERYFNLNR